MKRQTDPDVLLLQAAADPTRLAILRELSEEERCACDFTACCDVSQPTARITSRCCARPAGWTASGAARGSGTAFGPKRLPLPEFAGGFSPGPARRVTGTDRRLSVV